MDAARIVGWLSLATAAVALTVAIMLVQRLPDRGSDAPHPAWERTPFTGTVGELQQPEVLVNDPTSTWVVPLDARKGTYALEWATGDGAVRSVLYTRPDVAEAVVRAKVAKGRDRAFRYLYCVENLATSGQYLKAFIVQTFPPVAPAPGAAPVDALPALVPIVGEERHVGRQSGIGPKSPFKEGVWWSFGLYKPESLPGRSVLVALESNHPPALVEAKVRGGPSVLTGVDGHGLPGGLEDILLRSDAWPSGYTIGPSARRPAFGSREFADELLEQLERFASIGWMRPEVVPRYRALLGTDFDRGRVRTTVRKDRIAGNITTEIESLLAEHPKIKALTLAEE